MPRPLAGKSSRCRAATGKQFTAYQQVLRKSLNNLWVNCGSAVGFVIVISYRGLTAFRYAESSASPADILTKFAADLRKVSRHKLFNGYSRRGFLAIASPGLVGNQRITHQSNGLYRSPGLVFPPQRPCRITAY